MNALNLNVLKMNTLVSMVNELGGNATAKTFSQRSKAVERLTKLADAQKVDLSTFFNTDGTKALAPVPVIDTPAPAPAPAPVEAAAPKAPKVKAPKEPKAPKEKKISIRSVAEALIVKVVSTDEKGDVGLSYEDILAEIKSQFPEAKTTISCLRWYAVRLREANTVLPQRARAAKPVVEAPAVETPAVEAAVEAPAATEEVVA